MRSMFVCGYIRTYVHSTYVHKYPMYIHNLIRNAT